MKTIFNSALAAALVAVSACDDGGSDGVSAREASTQAEDLLGGDAAEAERIDHEGTPAWEIAVAMANGATIEVKLHADTGDLLVLEDKTGPFDYDIAPVDGALSFAAIQEKAFAEVAGTVEAWELEAEAEGGEVEYEWELYIRDADGQLWEMFLHADDGHVSEIEAKEAVDG